jgi:hypothetical protein
MEVIIMENALKIAYIGDDDSYWFSIRERYKARHNNDFDFVKIFEADPEQYQFLYIDLFYLDAKIIYIDLTYNFEAYINLAKLIKNEIVFKDVVLVGLVDDREHLNECYATGIEFIHIKCAEHHDVVYDPFRMAFPQFSKRPDFATANFLQDITVYDNCRVNYISPVNIRIESNMKLKIGDVIELETEIPASIVPSKKYKVVQQEDENFRYRNYDYAYQLQFILVDKPELNKAAANIEIEKELYKEKIANYENDFKTAAKKLKEWVQDRANPDVKHISKLYVIDRDLNVLKTKSTLDKFNNIIFSTSSIRASLTQILKMKPDIIAFQFDDKLVVDGMTEEEKESLDENHQCPLDELNGLMKEIIKRKGYHPFIFVFNTKKYTKKLLQDSFHYNNILANPSKMNIENVIALSDMLDKKKKKVREEAIKKKIQELRSQNPSKYGRLTVDNFEEPQFIPLTNDKYSFAARKMEVQLRKLTESEAVIAADDEIPHTTYTTQFPIPMGIRLIDIDGKHANKEAGKFLHLGLLHSIDEEDKKKIRMYVNEIFFSSINDQRAKEAEEFAKLHEEALKKKSASDELDQLAEGGSDEDDDEKKAG